MSGRGCRTGSGTRCVLVRRNDLEASVPKLEMGPKGLFLPGEREAASLRVMMEMNGNYPVCRRRAYSSFGWVRAGTTDGDGFASARTGVDGVSLWVSGIPATFCETRHKTGRIEKRLLIAIHTDHLSKQRCHAG
jgi:hypothetical protein